jgi:hypothetical protein
MAKTVVSGKEVMIKLDDIVVGCASDGEFSSSVSMVEASCRESGNFFDAVPDKFEADLSLNGIVIYDSPADPTAMRAYDIAALHMNKTLIDWSFGIVTTGQKSWAGQGYITEYTETAPQDGVATYSAKVKPVGIYGTVTNPA